MAIKVFADGANLEGMLDVHDNGNVQGFTTNPSLMKAGGVTDYRAFAKTVLEHITDVSVSFNMSRTLSRGKIGPGPNDMGSGPLPISARPRRPRRVLPTLVFAV